MEDILNNLCIKYKTTIEEIKSTRPTKKRKTHILDLLIEFSEQCFENKTDPQAAANLINRTRGMVYHYARHSIRKKRKVLKYEQNRPIHGRKMYDSTFYKRNQQN